MGELVEHKLEMDGIVRADEDKDRDICGDWDLQATQRSSDIARVFLLEI